MKTYILDILNRYNRFSEKLDVKTILCNKSWLVFNDKGNKELYIFQENGNLIASVNGNVLNGNWQYIPANKSIIITFKEQSYMLHPSFFDKTIFALQQDGTNKYAFMIDEKQSQSFQPKSLTELNSYFENIERKKIEEEQHRRKLLAEQQRANEQRRIEEEHREQIKRQEERVQQYLNKKRLEYWEYYQSSILISDSVYLHLCTYKEKWERKRIITIFAFIFGIILGLIYNDNGLDNVGAILSLILVVASIIFFIINGFFSDYPSEDIKEYKENIKNKIFNGDFDNYIFNSPHNNKKNVEQDLESIDDFETRISNKNNRKKNEQERENRRKQEIEDNKKRKNKEWEEYIKQREQKDFDRIEQHRIEREKREKEEKLLRKQENIKKE